MAPTDIFENGRTHSLPVPYLSELRGGELQPGQTVSVTGKALEGAEGFTISFCSGKRVEEGSALHIATQPHDHKLILNAFVAGDWGKQVKEKLTFKAGEEFDIRIRCHDHHFEIFVNHKEIDIFDYQTPLAAVDHLLVQGCVELHSVNWAGRYYAVPYDHAFPHGLKPGHKLYVSGVPEDHGAKEFCISLLNSKGDVTLHVNPRFDEKAVIRNAKLNGVWGPEEREGKFVFDKKQQFDIIIANEAYSYQVYVNGRLFCAFAHRSEPTDVVEFQLCGDIELQNVHWD